MTQNEGLYQTESAWFVTAETLPDALTILYNTEKHNGSSITYCATSQCTHVAYYQCFSCESHICAEHTIRLPCWCQFHQDCCKVCYETLPEERKEVSEREE